MSRRPLRPPRTACSSPPPCSCSSSWARGSRARPGRPYPGFFVDFDHTILLSSPAARAAGLRDNDRFVGVGGGSPLILRAPGLVLGAPVRYTVERAGRPFTAAVAPELIAWPSLLVYRQSPVARPN
jgi:hypothetical protein